MTDSLQGVVLRSRMAKSKSKRVHVLKPVSDVHKIIRLSAFDPYCVVRRKRYDVPVEVYEPNDFEKKILGIKDDILSVEDL